MASLRVTRRGAAAFLLFLATGCQEATQVTIDLSTDALCAGDPNVDDVFDSAAFYVTSADALDDPVAGPFPDATTQPGQCRAGDPLSEIGTLGIIPGESGTDASVGLRILVGVDGQTAQACAEAGCSDARCIDIRRRVGFVESRSLLLPVAASRNCLGLCCEDGETCVDGACVGVEVPPCDPEVQICAPVEPGPPIGQRWSFSVPDAGFRIVASRGRLDPDGNLIVGIAGSYPPRADNGSPLRFGDQPLHAGTGNGVFMARIVVSSTGGGSVSRVASCTGPDVAVRDLAFDDGGPVALVTRRQGIACRDGAAIEVGPNTLSEQPHLWHLNAATSEDSLEQLYAPLMLGANSPSAVESIAFGAGDTGNTGELHVAGTHVGAPAALTLDGATVPLATSPQSYFYRASFGTSFSMAGENLWALGLAPSPTFAQAVTHQVVQAGADITYSIGAFTGPFTPLAVGDAKGASLFAVREDVLDERMVATGGIAAVGRARRRLSTENVLVPVVLDAEQSPQFSVGAADPIPLEGRTVALLEFASGSADLVLTADGDEPHAAGAQNVSCLAFEREGRGVLACEGRPELTFGEGVEMMGLDAAVGVEPTPTAWLVMMGRTTGDLGAGFPSLEGLEAGPRLFFAGSYATN